MGMIFVVVFIPPKESIHKNYPVNLVEPYPILAAKPDHVRKMTEKKEDMVSTRSFNNPTETTIFIPFQFVFPKLTPVCNLSCVANQRKTFILLGSLLF
jgi:hypothetical protein